MAAPQDGTPQRTESGKQRALRIPLDYYKGSDGLRRTKNILTVAALVAALAWWGIGLASPKQSAIQYTHGPISKAHADIEADCTKCHVPWHPITGQKGPALLVGDFHASDARCEACHGPADVSKNGAGGPHHKSQKKEDTNSCGGCHRDHRGDVSLVKLADADCVSCHRDVKAHMNGSPQFANTVTQFDKDHPEFAAIDKKKSHGDPGKLRFNHALHTAAGLETGFTYGELPKADRARYGWKDGDDLNQPVHLDCAACHKTDPKGPGANAPDEPYGPGVAQRLQGAYMEPITYANQCRACHPITDHLNDPLPHGLQPPELQKELTKLLAKAPAGKPSEPAVGQRVVPGNALSAQQIKENSSANQLLLAEKYLYLGRANCGECHEMERKEGQIVPERIIPPDVPAVWFTHALFNHAKHKEMKCVDCHAGASTSKDHKDVLLPDVRNCKQCHAPGGSTTIGKAGSECTECHRYHHGNPAFMTLQTPRDKRFGRDMADFLQAWATEKRPSSRR